MPLKAQDFDLSEGLSLYVHIPFCQSKCHYCDFFSRAGQSRASWKKVLAAIYAWTLRQLEALRIDKLATVYIGGGTPSLMDAKDLAPFLQLAQELGSTETTVEANPEHINPEWVSFVFAAGASRLSVGLQSFSQPALAAVGRQTSRASMERALDVLEPYKAAVSLDLMAGLPGQDQAAVRFDVERIVRFNPSHASLYALTIEKNTVLASRRQLLAPQEERDRLWETAKTLLEQAGYTAYEISNYTKPGQESRHNLRYWHLLPYLGAGPAAVSCLPLKAGGAWRLTGSRVFADWTGGGTLQTSREVVSKKDFLFEHFMMGLRTRFGVDKARFFSRFQQRPEEILNRLNPAMQRHLRQNSASVRLSAQGRLWLDSFLVSLLDILP